MRPYKIEDIPYSNDFYLIKNILMEELMLPIEGKGTYIRKATSPGNYAYISLRISQTPENSSTTICDWSLIKDFPEKYRSEAESVMSFFASHIAAIIGKKTGLFFQPLEISFWIGQTRTNDFKIATVRAIINAFSNTLHQPNLQDVRK